MKSLEAFFGQDLLKLLFFGFVMFYIFLYLRLKSAQIRKKVYVYFPQPEKEGSKKFPTHEMTFILTFLITFVLLMSLGHLLSNKPYLNKVWRFHPNLSAESLFFPTFSGIHSSVLRSYQPGKIIVIIGGSSGFYGVSQPLNQSMSIKIQENLGANYIVRNLAFRGGNALGQGYLIAEALRKKGYPVIYVADAQPGGISPLNAVKDYEYFYWQAKAEESLFDYSPRDSLASSLSSPFNTSRINAHVNHVVRHVDLWNWITFNYGVSLVNPYGPREPFKPRKDYVDPEVIPDKTQLYPGNLDDEKRIYEGTSSQVFTSAQWTAMMESWDASIPPKMREICFFAVGIESPKIRKMVDPQKDKSWREQRMLFTRKLGVLSINSGVFADDYLEEDYVDRSHLSVQGGEKTANFLSKAILEISRRVYG